MGIAFSFKMPLTRQLLLSLLTAYLNQEISAQEVYDRGLSIAFSDEYETVIQQDPLIKATLQALMDSNPQDPRQAPARSQLEYYQRCLAGQDEYLEKGKKKTEAGHLREGTSVQQQVRLFGQDFPKTKFSILLRAYVLFFALSSLFINFLSILQPNFISFGEGDFSRAERWGEASPYIFYSLVLLIPIKLSCRGILFYGIFPVLTLGMFYYWYVSFAPAMDLSLGPFFPAVMFLFGALPATLAWILLLICREENRKKGL
ncbi:MAG: hypothetical protein NUV91_08545 [Candidatus Omnitrophica bacterium]|nr:hypothetical protein [Candidatus Omnitrophota bacterium]